MNCLQVTDAVHAQGSYIYLQMWAIGRAASPDVLKADGNYPYVSASDVRLKDKPFPPRPLTLEGELQIIDRRVALKAVFIEVKEYIQLYAIAAKNAIHAGFDGVEIHGANGYLIDQFTQDMSNKRTDEYGGSIENRTRFALDVTDAVCKAIGESKTGIRLSPWGAFNGWLT